MILRYVMKSRDILLRDVVSNFANLTINCCGKMVGLIRERFYLENNVLIGCLVDLGFV